MSCSRGVRPFDLNFIYPLCFDLSVILRVLIVVGLDIQPSTSESVSTLTSYGPTSARAGFTSTSDVARALAQLVVLASTSWDNLSESVGVKTGGADVSVVHVRIQGSAYSFEDIARVIEEVRGKGKVELKSESLRDVRDRTREGYLGGTITTPVDHIR